MPNGSILVVDDDRNLLKVITIRLESLGYEVSAFSDGEGAKREASQKAMDLAIIDLQLEDQDGISLMQELHRTSPHLPIIIFTAHGTIESAVEAMRLGAYTYLTKPFDARELAIHIERALEQHRLTSELTRLRGMISERYEFSNIVARSKEMQRVLELVSRIAGNDSTVYIHGESGTGKEVIAKAIHLSSRRRDNPFVAINCAALPEPLLESELFGHAKGAFTGAIRDSKGLFVQAHGGTILLDEIGDMPLSIQAKLLRVLQERQFYPLGGDQPQDVDIRVLVATNKDLGDLVAQSLFREDLFYRVNVIPVSLPPLRERREDIPLLAEAFLKEFRSQMNTSVQRFSRAAIQRLLLHDWPGNVRELKNAIEYAVAMAQQSVIDEDLILPGKIKNGQEAVKPFKAAKDEFEKNYLSRLLEVTQGNISAAAKLAGKYRADLYDLFRKHGINPKGFKE